MEVNQESMEKKKRPVDIFMTFEKKNGYIVEQFSRNWFFLHWLIYMEENKSIVYTKFVQYMAFSHPMCETISRREFREPYLKKKKTFFLMLHDSSSRIMLSKEEIYLVISLSSYWWSTFGLYSKWYSLSTISWNLSSQWYCRYGTKN